MQAYVSMTLSSRRVNRGLQFPVLQLVSQIIHGGIIDLSGKVLLVYSTQSMCILYQIIQKINIHIVADT